MNFVYSCLGGTVSTHDVEIGATVVDESQLSIASERKSAQWEGVQTFGLTGINPRANGIKFNKVYCEIKEQDDDRWTILWLDDGRLFRGRSAHKTGDVNSGKLDERDKAVRTTRMECTKVKHGQRATRTVLGYGERTCGHGRYGWR